MKLTNETPQSWRNLQDLVCKYLNEAGYFAESPKTIALVRGNVEVDVFATAKNELIRTFICECKYWSSPVPQEKVHAFRTIVHDSGSTLGILISKEGFQSGAYEAALCSNVLLKDWDGFLDLISEQWLFQRLLRLKRIAHPLSIYTDHLDIPYDQLTVEKQKQYIELTRSCFDAYCLGLNLNKTILQQETITVNNTLFSTCNSLFDYLENEYLQAIKTYKQIFEGCSFDTYKFEFGGYMLFGLMNEIFNNSII